MQPTPFVAPTAPPASGRITLSRFPGVLAAGLLAGALAAPGPVQGQDAAGQEDPLASMLRDAEAFEVREIGPTIMSGRVADLAVVESDPATFYVGTASGGVWKTENGGITFEAVFTDQETASIGAVTLAPSNPNVVWVGSGEPQNRQSSPWGNGVYRSVDAGRSWSHLGLEATHHIARIQVHPSDPDVAYVAAVGHLWGPNEERGVYRTTDGGETWERILFVDDDTGAIDLVMDPEDPRTLFAAMYQRRRRAWGFNGGGPGSGIYRTFDGGETWAELTDGLPEGDKGRIGLDIYRRDGDLVCAIVQADASGADIEEERDGVYCSTDRGETWEHRSTTNNRPMYYSQIRIDPNDPERIYLGGASLYRSSDGGRSFTADAASGVHLDHHALWIDPSNSEHLILGSDGGVSVSRDRSDNWYQFRNLPISQFYEVGVDDRTPYHVCGGLQDNGSWCAPSDSWSSDGIRTKDWYNVGSGDGFFTVHTDDPDVMFAESQGGNLTRVDLATMERARIRPDDEVVADGEEVDLRWNWDTPVVVSTHDPETVYIGANILFRSRDLGQSWTAVSPDLSYAFDRDTLELMGVAGSEPQMSRNDGQSSYGTLTAVAESPLDADVLYTGADDGRLHVTRDGGASWTDITENVPDLPDFTYVTRLVASHHAAGRVYAAFDGHRSDDFAPYVYVSEDFGGSWRPIVDGLPQTSVNAIEEHPDAANLLFVGNEVGAFVSVDRGRSWARLDGGFPTVPVDDITIQTAENDLVLGTHGRGIWIVDDIGPLVAMATDLIAAAPYLVPVQEAVQYNEYRPQGWTPGIWEAENPDFGSHLRYWLPTDADSVSISILDADGTVLRELEGEGDAGLHEVVWDMRRVETMANGEEMDGGPRVLPGSYTARLHADGRTSEQPLAIALDPRVDISRADLVARQEAMLESYRLSGPAEAAEDALDEADDQLQALQEMLQEADRAPADLVDRVAALRDHVGELEDELGDADDGAGLLFRLQSVHAPPTADALRDLERSWAELPDVISRINDFVTEAVPPVFADVFAADVGFDPIEPAPLPVRG